MPLSSSQHRSLARNPAGRHLCIESLEDRLPNAADMDWFAAPRGIQAQLGTNEQSFLVTVNSNIRSVQEAADQLARSGVRVTHGVGRIGTVEARYTGSTASLLQIQGVVSVERNQQLHALGLSPADPGLQSQWGLSKVNAPSAWAAAPELGRERVIAVLDTGLDSEHNDLRGQILQNLSDPIDGIDNDANGFVDDFTGYDFVGNDAVPMDENNHGTHVAGIIGAAANNVGVVGIAPNVKIMPLRFLNASGSGLLSDAIRGINYATMMRSRGVPIMAINASWGGGGYSETLYNSIRDAGNAGILFVAAAGNDGTNNDFAPAYPAAYALPNVIAVGATDSQDRYSNFSNYGNSVSIAAPGVSILSDLRGGVIGTMSGTSMAAPFVSGAIALVAAHNPGLTSNAIRDRILSTATLISGPIGVTKRLDVAAAVGAPRVLVPSPPKSLSVALRSVNSVTLQWMDKSTNEGYFEIQSKNSNGTSVVSVPANTTRFKVANLPTGNSEFRIRAVNIAGHSAWSNLVTTSPLVLPGAVRLAAKAGTTTIDVNFHATKTQAFRLYLSSDGGRTYRLVKTIQAPQQDYQITGLRRNTAYLLYMEAINSDGITKSVVLTQRTR